MSTIWQDDGFDTGTTVRFTANLTTAGVAIDATSVVFRLKKPDGTIVTPSTTHGATGVYTADYVVDQAGEWYLRWEATSPTTTHEAPFFVRDSAFD